MPGHAFDNHCVQAPAAPLDPAVADRVQREMGGDAEQPGGELRRRLIAHPRAVHAEKRLLREFLGHGVILHHAVDELDHRSAVPLHQHSETRRVAVANAQHQLRIAIGREDWFEDGSGGRSHGERLHRQCYDGEIQRQVYTIRRAAGVPSARGSFRVATSQVPGFHTFAP